MQADSAKEGEFFLPVGTVTFLLTDIEGSARLWEADPEAMARAVAHQYDLVDDLIGRHGGVRPKEQGEGDSMVAAFPRASDALACALGLQQAISKEEPPAGPEIRIRIGLHTGEAQLRDEGNYFGQAVTRCARLRDTAHGGQTVLSQSTYDLVIDRLPQDATLKDLGSHRLKDLARPEHVYQLSHPDLPEEFPPLRSLDSLPNNLPLQLTSFIGREEQMAEIRRLLSGVRMITLTGSGGCGKTRLALQVAADLLDIYPDGVWWVDLASITDPFVVPSALADALKVKEVPMETLTGTLARELREKRLMLILDNCEHLVSACASLADGLLRSCSSLSIIATSREPLGVEGETPWRVPSLTLPTEMEHPAIEALGQYEAVRLFIDRAIRSRPNFEVTNENASAVAETCQRLDGIPLAIELAAARVRMLTPDEIVRGLSDRFHLLVGGARTALPRQQTLEASVDWSYNLLSEEEALLLRRLSVFAGGFTLNAAEEVCAGEGITSYQVLDLLSRLVDQSLVQPEDAGPGTRYLVLETIRQYARRKLGESGESQAVMTRHLDYFLALVEQTRPEWGPLRPPGLLEETDEELDNIRIALAWAETSKEADKALRLAAGLGNFWWVRHPSEGRTRLLSALSLTGGSPQPRAKALAATSWVSLWLWDLPAANSIGEEALALSRDLGDTETAAEALCWLGAGSIYLAPDRARAPLRESLELARQAGAQAFVSGILSNMAGLETLAGNPRLARLHAREALEIGANHGWTAGRPLPLYWLGFAESMQGDFVDARTHLEESLGEFRELKDNWYISLALGTLARLAIFRGAYEEAAALNEESLRVAESSGNPFLPFMARMIRGILAFYRGELSEAAGDLEEGFGAMKALGLDSVAAFPLPLLGEIARLTGDLERDLKNEPPALSFERDVLAPTLVGHWGEEPRPEGRSMSIDMLVDSLVAELDEAELDRPDIVGKLPRRLARPRTGAPRPG